MKHRTSRRLITLLSVPFVLFVLSGCSQPAPEQPETSTEPASQVSEPARSTPETTAAPAATPAATTDRVIRRGGTMPNIVATDIAGKEVNLDAIIASKPELVIAFFFMTTGGRDIALKLKTLEYSFREMLQVVAFGLREDEAALKQFASDLGITYYLLDKDALANQGWVQEITSLPLTLFIHPNEERRIVNMLVGAGEENANLIKEVAANFFKRKKLEQAEKLAETAKEAGENPTEVTKLRGFIHTEQGKLDEAEAEFGQIDAKDGLAKVALERGQYDQAIAMADQAGGGSAYADVVKAMAYAFKGEMAEAAKIFEQAEGKPAEDWQKSEAANGHGRVLHQLGETDAAIGKYRQAVDLSVYNVEALSNEGAALREQGKLEEAEATLKEAQKWGGDTDELIAISLKQIAEEKQRANDLALREYISERVKALGERFRELRAQGRAEPEDPWSTRPQIMAVIPSSLKRNVFFERAGMDIAIVRELQSQLAADERIRVVEREILDQLLQELDIGTSELADKNTQLQLGKVLSARAIGIVEFITVGSENTMYFRVTDTETTNLIPLPPQPIPDPSTITSVVQGYVQQVVDRIVEKDPLQGLIVEVQPEDTVMINLGRIHGVKPEMKFMVLQFGPPRVVGGREFPGAPEKLADLDVFQIDEDYALCKVSAKNEGVVLAPEMRIRQRPS